MSGFSQLLTGAGRTLDQDRLAQTPHETDHATRTFIGAVADPPEVFEDLRSASEQFRDAGLIWCCGQFETSNPDHPIGTVPSSYHPRTSGRVVKGRSVSNAMGGGSSRRRHSPLAETAEWVSSAYGRQLIRWAHPTAGEVERVQGLPAAITVCLFDLDGVLTDTATVHSASWKQTFDEFLEVRDGTSFRPFTQQDYEDHVDGEPRADGVRDFLGSRGIQLPEGRPDDPPDALTVNGVGNRKNELLLKQVHLDGVRVYEGSRQYLEAAKKAGVRRFVVSSSANTTDVLKVTGLDQLIEGQIDGNTLRERNIKGKPAPDSFLAGAALAGVDPAAAVVFEDAVAGVQAACAGRFGYVVGVNRLGAQHAADLRQHGANLVIDDLARLLEKS